MTAYRWPATAAELENTQREIAGLPRTSWKIPGGPVTVGACYTCFARHLSGPGAAGDRSWTGAVVIMGRRVLDGTLVVGQARGPYEPGLLALREGPQMEEAVRALAQMPDVLVINATGLDHPRRCGLALHLGAVLGLPTVGVTHRPLRAAGVWPAEETGSTSPLTLDGEVVGYWLRTKAGARPLAVHAGWQTTPDVAVAAVLKALHRSRTPEPLRRARELAREARSKGAADA